MPTMAYIQDGKTRLTIQSGQSLGVSGLKPGKMAKSAFRIVSIREKQEIFH